MCTSKYMTWMSIFILSSVSCQNSLENICNGQKFESSCVSVTSCQYVINLIRRGQKNEAKNMFCGFDNHVPKVCCPKENAIIFENETERVTTNKPKIVTTPKTNRAETVSTSARTTPKYLDPFPDRSICGQAKNDDKIIGGQIAGIDEFPWLTRIKLSYKDKEEYGCAGSLITDRHVLTAAHCVELYKVISVRLGEFNTNTEQDCIETGSNTELECNDKPLDVPVKGIIPYPGYNVKEYTKGDIALLVLEHSVRFTDFIQPVCLPTTEYTAVQDYLHDSSYVTAGWGATEYDDQSNIKRKVNLNAVPINVCQTVFSSATNLVIPESSLPNIICAGGRKSQDSCQGDSGGSLVREVSENNTINWYLYGITSFGAKNCGEEGVPGLYTRVTVFMDWIREQVVRT